jgi:hypothetical protein
VFPATELVELPASGLLAPKHHEALTFIAYGQAHATHKNEVSMCLEALGNEGNASVFSGMSSSFTI